jgi:hypothetical protein
MCEPTHSIVQFPDQDDDGNPTGGLVDAIPLETKGQDGFWQWMKKRIGSWFHFSRLGNGHSEALGLLTVQARRRLPADTKYEATWWNRKVHLDGLFNGQQYDAQLALDCATTYAKAVSIGGLTQLRRFLATSMKKSERPWSYAETFVQMLKMEGYNAFNKLVKKFFGSVKQACTSKLDELIKLMLGFTRKRRFLVDAWADDGKLWVPATPL